jgi:SAM-dependent methyltransferase
MTDIAFWDRIAPRYARSKISNIPAYEATLAAVARRLSPRDRVLETGCGTGSTALKLAPLVAEYTATDISGGMIEVALGKPAPENLRFAAAAAAPAGRDAAGSYDAVLSFNLLHLVQDLDGALAEAHRLLRPGGLYITKTPCLGEMNPLLRMLVPVMRLVGKAPWVRSLHRDGLERHIRGAGFAIEEVRTFTGAKAVWYVVARRV